MLIYFEGVPALPYIFRGDRVIWKVLAEYSWSPTTTRSGSFLCTVASATPIRVVTREVRYIHELSLTLEHSMPISSPAAPGLTRLPILGGCYLDFPDTLRVRSLLDSYQGALLFSGLERELLFLAVDVETDFASSNIDLCSGSAKEWPPKDSVVSIYILVSSTTK